MTEVKEVKKITQGWDGVREFLKSCGELRAQGYKPIKETTEAVYFEKVSEN